MVNMIKVVGGEVVVNFDSVVDCVGVKWMVE